MTDPGVPGGAGQPAEADGGVGFAAIPGAGAGKGASPAGAPPTGGPSAPPAPAPLVRRGGGRRRLIIVGVLVAFLVVVGFAVKNNVAPNDLNVGDCFDVPSQVDSISTVAHHACTDAHTAEVIVVASYPDAATYPAIADFEPFAETTCNPAFAAYVGIDVDSAPDLSIGYFYPLTDGWSSGDRIVTCYVARTDDGQMTQSVKGSGGGSASQAP